MRKQIFSTLLLVFLACPIVASSQETGPTLFGIVTDSETHLPIPRVSVTAIGDQGAAPAATDSKGFFKLKLAKNVEKGASVHIRFEKPEYESYDENVVASPEVTIQISLDLRKMSRKESVSPKPTEQQQNSETRGTTDTVEAKRQHDGAKDTAETAKPESPSRPRESKPGHPPSFTFHDKSPDFFTLLMGNTTLNLAKGMLTQQGGWHGFASIDGYEPLTIYVKDDTLHVDAVVQDSSGQVTYKIENGGTEVTVLPPRWDRNWAENELEIVDDKEVPVFQMIVRRPSVIELSAIFYGTRGSVIGARPKQKLFRYPSWEHPGERIGGGTVTNPTVNNSYGQFPPPGVIPNISICLLKSNVLAAGEYRTVFTIKTDAPISSPAWWFQFDGPVEEVIPSLESTGFGATHDHPRPGEIEHAEDVVGFALNNIGGIGSQEPLRQRNVITATVTSQRPVNLVRISGRSLNQHIQENFLFRCGD